jgi:polyketide-type polyunsaturated fatty acid synthase PfaA
MNKNTGNNTIDQDTRQNTDPVRLSKFQNKIVPVGVIGLGSLFPGSSNLQGYWRDIKAGRNRVTEVPPSHLHIEHFYDPDPLAVDKTYCKQGAFLSPIEFDPIEFGIPPKNLSSIDTSQLLSLLVAKQVLEDAFDGKFKTMDRSRIGIIMGVAAGLDLLGEMAGRLTRYQWVKGMREAGLQEDKIDDICNRILNTFVPWTENTFPGLLANIVSGRIANHFDLGGINCTSDAACASSFSALSQALNELYMGSSDVVIVGGADTNNDSFLFVSFSKTPALSPTHDCRPFSDKADGMVLGEGIAMLALKRLDDAIRDGDRIYAVIKGIGVSSDGAGSSIYAPVAEGQASALKRCYEAASYGPETVELVEAHGTATPAGDVIEVKALKSVFQETQRQDRNWCALGSVKSQIGHTKSTAATAGIIKAILGLHHKVLPPTIKVERINPTLGIEDSPFYVNTETRPWIRDDSYPRRASVSAFGFGGTNFHVTLEEYRGPGRSAYRLRNAPSELVLLSSSDARALKALCIETAAVLDKKGMLPYIAKTSQESFEASSPARLAIVATDERDLADKLSCAEKLLQNEPGAGFTTPNGIDCSLVKAAPGAIAFLFPGQGSSGYVGMGSDLAMFFSDVIDIWDQVAAFDKNRKAAVPLHRVVYPIPAFTEAERNAQMDKLKDTKWAQPAVLTTSIAMSQILKGLGVRPSYVGGHSLGEITALHEAGVVDFDGVLNLCFKRAELMAAASLKPGVMTAVFGNAKKIQSVLDKLSTKIVISNYNDPTQVVLSGPVPDMEKVESALKEEKVKYNRLPVYAAFHSFLMDDACMRYREYLKTVEFKPPNIPIYSNLNGARHANDSEEIREALAKQINSPVQFVNEIEAMYSDGARTFIEVGPSHVLSSFVDNILKDRLHTTINMDSKNENGVTSLWKSLGKIALSGVPLDFSHLWKDFAPVSDPRKSKKAKFSITLSGANYAKTYPSPEGIDTFPKPNPTNPEITSDKNARFNAGSRQVNHNTNDAAARVSEKQRSKETGMSTPKNSPPPIDYGSATLAAQSETAPLRSNLDQQTSSPWMNAPQPNQGSFSGNLSSYLAEYFKIQKQTAETYSVYQKTMAESHMSFLNAAESSNRALCTMLTGQPLRGRPNAAQEDTASPPHVVNQVVNTERHSSAPSCIEPPAFFSEAEALLTTCVDTQQTDAACQHIDIKDQFLTIVSDKTGYPIEILTVDMNLEADLGIDSIKRVEIFSAVKDEHAWLPEIEAEAMSEIHTLGDVIRFIEKHAPEAGLKTIEKGSAEKALSSVQNNDMNYSDMFLNIVAD